MGKVELPSGISLNTKIDGPDDAPWVILSNSLGTDLSMWDGQIDLLTRKYRVLRYDQRGHGGSDCPEGRYSFDILTADVIDMMDVLGIDQADWIGVSMGAMTGMGLALGHPDRFDRMIFADARADAPESYRSMWDQRMAAVEAGGMEAIADGSLALWLTEDWRAANPEATQKARNMLLGIDPTGYTSCCYALRELDYLKDLGKITKPVLYICGSKDKGAAPEVMKPMAEATPGAQYHEIADAGHIPNINQPRAFNAAVAQFLNI